MLINTNGAVIVFVLALFVGCGGDFAPQDAGGNTGDNGLSAVVVSEQVCPNARGAREQALSGGRPDETVDHRAVVNLGKNTREGTLGVCTGTFIAPDKVLTAAHCVCTRYSTGTTITAEECMEWNNFLWIVDYNEATQTFTYLGRSSGGGGGIVTVHPDFTLTLDDDGHMVEITHDVAVLTLTPPAENIVIMAIANTAPELCASAMIVGFGNNAMEKCLEVGNGIRREGSVVVTKLFSDILVTNPLADGAEVITLHGDSGGPLLILGEDGVEQVVGITSYGSGANTSVFTNVVTYRDWIMAQ